MTKRTGSTRKKGTATGRNNLTVLLILALAFCLPAVGQDREAGLWTGLELEKGLNGWLELRISAEHRRDRNLRRMEGTLVESGLKADLGKYLETDLYYRYTRKSLPETGTAGIHRLYADLTFEYDWGELTASQRMRVTVDKNPAFRDDPILEKKARMKTGLEYNIRKTPLRVDAAAEFFFSSPVRERLYSGKNRVALGLDYTLSRNLSLELAHHYERGTTGNRPVEYFIWVVRMKYVL